MLQLNECEEINKDSEFVTFTLTWQRKVSWKWLAIQCECKWNFE